MTAIACRAETVSARSAEPVAGSRFVFIDALRALAALAVLACHFMPKNLLLFGVVGNGLLGWIGVETFFVISGFVIAYSVRKSRITPGFLGNFALRRSLRLDPPYWATIVAAILAGAACHRLLPAAAHEPCTLGRLAAHLVYLQTAFGYQDLCDVFWTLRLEVLFYLLFIVTLGVVQTFESKVAADWRPVVRQTAFLLLATLSLTAFVVERGPGVLRYWHMFLLGATVWWSLESPGGRRISWLLRAFMLLSLAVRPNLDAPAALAAALLIYGAGRLGRLETWLGWSWLQYLGRISYSLYLIHLPIRDVLRATGVVVSGDNPIAAQAWNLAALAASFGAAHLLYRRVEAPSIAWARSCKTSWSVRPAMPAGDAFAAAWRSFRVSRAWRFGRGGY